MMHCQPDTLRRRRGDRRRRRRAGMTLIEIMIVVAIMAMIASAVGFQVVKAMNQAKKDRTKSDIDSVRSAVSLYLATHNECPSINELADDSILNTENGVNDAWDNEFRIECDSDEVYVTSAGPDGQYDTEDDIPERSED